MIYIGLILSVILLSISILHFYWGIGGEWKKNEAVPTTETGKKVLKPGPFACFVMATGLLSFAAFVLVRANILKIYLPHWISASGLWVIAAIFLLRAIGDFKYIGLFKEIKQTPFARNDSKFYSPLCLAIGILCILLEMLK